MHEMIVNLSEIIFWVVGGELTKCLRNSWTLLTTRHANWKRNIEILCLSQQIKSL